MDREYALGLQGEMICRCRDVGMEDVIRDEGKLTSQFGRRLRPFGRVER
jgi:hypothetical protein